MVIRVIEGRVLLKPIVKPTDKISEFCKKEHGEGYCGIIVSYMARLCYVSNFRNSEKHAKKLFFCNKKKSVPPTLEACGSTPLNPTKILK